MSFPVVAVSDVLSLLPCCSAPGSGCANRSILLYADLMTCNYLLQKNGNSLWTLMPSFAVLPIDLCAATGCRQELTSFCPSVFRTPNDVCRITVAFTSMMIVPTREVMMPLWSGSQKDGSCNSSRGRAKTRGENNKTTRKYKNQRR